MSTYGNFYIFDSGLAKKFGKKEAIFIAYILAWQKISKTGWVFRTQKEISENTTLSRYQQESARRKLKLVGVLSELRTGQPSRLYYKIDESQLEKYFSEKLEEKKTVGAENYQNERNSQSRMRETRNLEKSPTDNNIKPEEDEKSSVTNNITNNIDENSNFHLDPSPEKKSSSLIISEEKSKNIEEKAEISNIINHLKSKKKNQIYEIFLIYSKHYYSRYKSYPAFTSKLAGQIKYLFSSIRDIEKTERMIEAFINDESSFLCMRFHDFGLLISNINKYLVLSQNPEIAKIYSDEYILERKKKENIAKAKSDYELEDLAKRVLEKYKGTKDEERAKQWVEKQRGKNG